MALRAVVFDLFDTLVDLRFEDLERIEHDGKWFPASVAALHTAVAEHREIGFAAFLQALHGVDRALREIQVEEGRETSTRLRFARLLESLELSEPAKPHAERLWELGAYVPSRGKLLFCCPPLCLDETEADAILDLFERALTQ